MLKVLDNRLSPLLNKTILSLFVHLQWRWAHKNNVQLTSNKRKLITPTVDLTAKITSLFKRGRVQEALQMFDKMPQPDITAWNSLITGYARNGEIENARQVFDKMAQRDVVSWNAIIAGYVHKGRLQDACYLFDRMPQRNTISWNTIIKAYAHCGRVEDARHIFGQMPCADKFSWNLMISAYARAGQVEKAREMFDKMPHRDVVSWNTMITGYAQNGRVDDAQILFENVPERNEVSWNAIIAGYIQNGRVDDAEKLFQIMPQPKIATWILMITGYTQNGRLENARRLFDKMPERNVVSWNAMIMGYVQAVRIDDARQLFDEMPEQDVFSWNSMLTGYSQIGRIEEAQDLFDRIPQPDVVSWNAMVTGYAQNGRVEEARQLFDKMPERNLVSWNALIAGYEQNGYYDEALNIFSQMLLSGVKADHSSFTSTLCACANLSALGGGKQIQQYIIKTGISVDITMANCLITMYSKCGSIEDAQLVFDRMTKRDVISWNAIIAGNAQNGHAEEGLQLFKKMRLTGIKPNDVTFVGVLSACSHAGLVEEGRFLFATMSTDYCIIPSAEHYAVMVDLLGRAGLLNEAEGFINKMPFEADASIWGSLLAACRVHGNPNIAQRAATRLFELEPHNSGTYVLLSNIYAAVGNWCDALKVRKMMTNKGVKKQPGCSWIQLKNQLYTFIVGE